MADDVYQPDGDADVTEDEGILDPEDTLSDRGSDPYDEGFSPPERPLGLDEGTTAEEQHEGESLDERLAEEVPDTPVPQGDGVGDLDGGDGEVRDDEVGGPRSGRLVAPDEGAHTDAEKDMIAEDVGIDGAAASAEEAAVHLVDEGDDAT
ncbi:DUF5709 domain-containing protein [Streptomyces sp. NBC_01497]|uniref:DUF5709 domain-containing protein n=1 Tax=Streptomyces sp. NBC_01497 TaxID=2903885 RepID=UPI002E30DBDC|nr:DUF5709 domain-containing protein [Streptomyces sp. NBC_01497]